MSWKKVQLQERFMLMTQDSIGHLKMFVLLSSGVESEWKCWGGYFHQIRTWMCLPDLENLTISIALFPTHHYTSLTKLGAFYNNLPKIHPIYVIWAPSSLMKTLRSLYQISQKSAPKGRHTYVYHVNVRTPPVEMLQLTAQRWGKKKTR